MSEYCENVSKIGKRSAPKHAFSDKKMQRVCGQPKPAMFKPTISQLARKMSRTNSMQDNVARYVEERQRREREAKEREQAAGADLSFRPTINARSKQLAAKKRAQAASEVLLTSIAIRQQADSHTRSAACIISVALWQAITRLLCPLPLSCTRSCTKRPSGAVRGRPWCRFVSTCLCTYIHTR